MDNTTRHHPTAKEAFSVLTKRWDVMQLLLDGSASKAELELVLGVSRSTIHRAISELEEMKLIRRTIQNRYRLSSFGRLLIDLWEQVERRYESISTASTAGIVLPEGTLGESVIFDDALVFHPEPHAPDLPLRRLTDRVRVADRVRAIVPAIFDQFVAVCSNQLRHGELAVDFIATTTASEWLRTEYGTKLSEDTRDVDFRLYETTEEIPFGLVLFDSGSSREAGLVLGSIDGVCGFVCTDSRSALDWATNLYEEYREDATEISTVQSASTTQPSSE